MNLENYYISGLPIKCKDLGIIYQPTIMEMFELGITPNEIYGAFVALEKVFIESDSYSKFQVIKELYNLSKLLETTNPGIFDVYGAVIESLKLLYKTKDINFVQMDDVEGILIRCDNYNCAVNVNNFDSLCNIVFEMFCINKNDLFKEDYTVKKYKNPLLQEAWEKIHRYRSMKEKKEELKLVDIINVVSHMDNNIEYDKVLNLTYYQLINSYKTLMKKNGFSEYLAYKTSPKFDIKEDAKHWTIESKVERSNYSKE